MEIRRFNEGDWRDFGGSERFPNGEEPWILEGVKCGEDFPANWFEGYDYKLSVVGDKNGIEVSGIEAGMFWHPFGGGMELSSDTVFLILSLFSLLPNVSHKWLISMGFEEY